MRAVIQRVNTASVSINQQIKASINKGLVLLVAFEAEDQSEDLEWLAQKIINLRIFADKAGKMNLSVQDIAGELLVVSQFTLFASTKKGNRPSFLRSAKPAIAIPLYEKFVALLSTKISTQTGTFGADMQINLCNDGPVTIIIDTKDKE